MITKIALFILYISGILALFQGLDYVLSPDNILKQESVVHQIAQIPGVFATTLIVYFCLVAYLQISYYKKGYKII